MLDQGLRRPHPTWRRLTGLTALMLALAGPAASHDTWFAWQFTDAGNPPVLALTTGAQFPLQETAIDTDFLRRSGCSDNAGTTSPLRLQRYADTASLFHAPAATTVGHATCWAETTTFEIELPADKVAAYLDEVRATSSQRQAWATLQARGLPWKETYSKHARIEATMGDGGAADQAGPAAATGMAMDVLLQAASRPVRVGDDLVFQVLRDGMPLTGFNVELRSERSPVGLWLRTDQSGQVRVRAPAAGAWLLRGIDLRQSSEDPTRWDSRFVTLAFTVATRPKAP